MLILLIVLILISSELTSGHIQLESFDLADKSNENSLIAIKSKANNNYVCAEKRGASYLVADRDSVNTWELFRLFVITPNTFVFQSQANKKFVSVDSHGGLIANKFDIDSSCLFKISEQKEVNGLLENALFLIKSVLNGKYVCIDHSRRLRTMFDHDHDGSTNWEAFYIERVTFVQYTEPHSFTWLG